MNVADRAERSERAVEARARGEEVTLLAVDEGEQCLAPRGRAMVAGGAQALQPGHTVATGIGAAAVVEQAASEHHEHEALLAHVSGDVKEVACASQLDHRFGVATFLRENVGEVLRHDPAEPRVGASSELLLRGVEVRFPLRELALQPDDEPELARGEHLHAEAPGPRGEPSCGPEIRECVVSSSMVDASEPSHEVELGGESTGRAALPRAGCPRVR